MAEIDLALIIQAIEKTADKAERIELLESYVSSFDRWLETTGALTDEATLAEALKNHEALMAKAKGWLEEGSQELAHYRQKTKVILAYVDTLPKRLSRYRPIKG